jgi:hypothetical protein
MSNVTYKQILTYFSQIAFAHEQINSFGFGDITQLTNDIETKKEPKYTRLYVVPQNVEFNQNHIHFNYAVMIYDKVEDDLSNLEEVMSDTLEIAMDVWTVFWQSYTQASGNFSKIVVGDWEPDTHPFVERSETILGGWTMHIKMSIPFDYNSCVVPMDPSYYFPQDQSYSSYFQILEDWKQFCEYHEQVRSYGFGPIEQLTVDRVTKQEPKYPRVYFVPERTRLNPNHMHITWYVVFADKLEDDYSNQQDVLSDTLEIAKDFYSKAYLSDYDVEWNATLEPWLENTESILAGWTLIISVQQKFDYNRCVLPIDSLADGITWEELAQKWKEVNQQWDEVKKPN